ncbi:MAG TPA: hypothetical protein VNK23_01515 [Candidatus Dormibacteraeota bacterium]|nr:hypothetical protein [Candidatus Dormibacteraeota bacterium]
MLIVDQLLNQYGAGEFAVVPLSSLAVYILRKVKRGVDGCGGETHVVALRKGSAFALTDDKDIKEMERRFEEFDKHANKNATTFIAETPLALSWHSESRKRKPKG